MTQKEAYIKALQTIGFSRDLIVDNLEFDKCCLESDKKLIIQNIDFICQMSLNEALGLKREINK